MHLIVIRDRLAANVREGQFNRLVLSPLPSPYSVRIVTDCEKVVLHRQAIVQPTNGCVAFSMLGDSGSLVYYHAENELHAVGLVHGGFLTDNHGSERYGLVCDLRACLHFLSQRVGQEVRLVVPR